MTSPNLRSPGHITLLILTVAFGLLAGCTQDPAAMNEVLQSVPSALQASLPPGVELLETTPPLTDADESETQTEASDSEADSENADAAEADEAESEADSESAAEASTTEVSEAEEASDTPEEEAITVSAPQVTVANRSVNIRGGPGLEFDVVYGALQGTTFETVGKTESGWWRICCVPQSGESVDEASGRAWISERVVQPNEIAEALPDLAPLFPNDLEASWSVVYQCGSERCAISECSGEVTAAVRNDEDPRYLEINRNVSWQDGCGENSTWLHQVERLEGTERYGNSTGLFLFDYWIGANPRPVNGLFSLNEESQVRVWCSEEQESELEESEGWTTVYTGKTCHDARTGMLVSMRYTKKWLFTGEFEGESYERAYFGDFEVYQVRLDETNVTLAELSSE